MLAKVIPILRLPRSLDVFDYSIPAELTSQVGVGSLVHIQFRKRRLLGVVDGLTKRSSTDKTIKPLVNVYKGLQATPIQLACVRLFAEYFFVSPATVANMIWHDLPRRFSLDFQLLNIPKKLKPRALPVASLVWTDALPERRRATRETVASALKKGKVVALIAPEIRTVKAWAEELQDLRPIVIHKQLPRQLYWERVASLSARRPDRPGLVIGTRSALLLPWPALGTIIIDEEENPLHRQSEQNPRFHSDQVARLLQKVSGCAVILHATVPRVTSYFEATRGKRKLIDRRTRQDWPSVRVVSLTDDRKMGNYSLVSEPLQLAIRRMLENRQLSILFLNRRGEANALTCQDCGHGFQCPRCQRPLTLHKRRAKTDVLICHVCGHEEVPPTHCPVCLGTTFKRSGWRLQKLESDVRTLFPAASIAVLDARAPKLPNRPVDIIIGTQLVLRQDFLSRAPLLGCILADQLLAFPDFSSPERAWRQLTQASLLLPPSANMYIQTFRPDHYAIRFAGQPRWADFYEEEIQQRKLFRYPPHARLIRLILKDANKRKVTAEAERLHAALQTVDQSPTGIEILQPGPSFIEKSRGQYRWEMVIKFADDQWTTVQKLVQLSNEKWLIDVDPLDLL